jgi:hypothetical protein
MTGALGHERCAFHDFGLSPNAGQTHPARPSHQITNPEARCLCNPKGSKKPVPTPIKS